MLAVKLGISLSVICTMVYLAFGLGRGKMTEQMRKNAHDVQSACVYLFILGVCIALLGVTWAVF